MKVSGEMQRQAKALADPSRFRLFHHITEAEDPVGVAELTELLGFNHNAIRQHLAILVDAGLVAATNEIRTVRGRPRKQYSIRADALHAFRSVSGSYERLAELLLEVAATDSEPYDVGFRAGRPANASNSDETSETATVANLIRQLAVDGFEPIETDNSTITLSHCPFADVAVQNQSVVCELHRGLIDGQLAVHDRELTGDLSPRHPHDAGCRVVVGLRPEVAK
ncbi:MAG: putative ArsR family transcriptional regulator [Candidatus Poriferisodalaceae bacterium]|jgi:predicted ArsR family transcriptional regulator